ncbi:MAG: ABC transporter substrate-binding protein, partial [Nanoarchaeota archaeon]|nr:ABC transporter substrate-binding protein [Nanoarchaeota archaeon]
VEVRSFPSGSSSAIHEGIASGDLDMGYVGLSSALIAITRRPVVIFATTSVCEVPIIVGLNSGIKDISGLKGKKIAVSRRGTWSDFIGRDLLSRYNINPDKDADMVMIPMPERLIAMKNGIIDAAVVSPWLAVKGRSMGISKVLVLPIEKFWPQTPGIVYIARNELVKNRKYDVKKIAQALKRSVDYINQNHKETAEIVSQKIGLSPELALEVVKSILWFSDLRKDKIRMVADALYKSGCLTKFPDIDSGVVPLSN